jgi:hypothetical protein
MAMELTKHKKRSTERGLFMLKQIDNLNLASSRGAVKGVKLIYKPIS